LEIFLNFLKKEYNQLIDIIIIKNWNELIFVQELKIWQETDIAIATEGKFLIYKKDQFH
jgi:hypothetical protein